jgi:hypothetical protein
LISRRQNLLVNMAVLMLTLGLGLLYLSTRSVNHEYDSLDYALRIERGRPFYELFHPHHLAHGYLCYLAFLAAKSLGYLGRAMELGQGFSAGLGALGIALFFWAMHKTTRHWGIALLASLGLAFTFGWWHASSILAVRVLNAVSLVAVFACVPFALKGSYKGLACLGLVHGFSILCHQTNVLLVPAILLVLWAEMKPGDCVRPWRPWLQFLSYGAGVAGISGGAYAFVGYFIWVKKTLPSFSNWVFAYMGVEHWNRPLAEPVKQVLFGWSNSFIGSIQPGPLVFGLAFDDVRTLLLLFAGALVFWLLAWGWVQAQGSMRGWGLFAVLVLGLAMLQMSQAWSALIGSLVLVSMSYWGLKQYQHKEASGSNRAETWPLLFSGAWLAAYVPFFIWWEPWNSEYWLAVLPAVFIVLGHAGARIIECLSPIWLWPLRWAVLGTCFFAVGAMAMANYQGKVAFDAQRPNNRYYRFLDETQNMRDEDVLVLLGDNAIPLYLQHYQPLRRQISVYESMKTREESAELALDDLERKIQSELKRHRVYLAKELVDGRPEDHLFLETRFGLEPGMVRRWPSQLDLRPVFIQGKEMQSYWRVLGFKAQDRSKGMDHEK